MPVSEDHALRQFEIEALQRINDNLRLLNNGQSKLVEGMHAIDLRLTRIESASVSAEVNELKHQVDDLKKDKYKREGALGLSDWFLRNWFSLGSMLVVIFVVLRANGKV